MSAPRLAHAHTPLSYLELALITVVLGVAAAVAIPEYWHLRQDANDDAAKTRLTQSARKLELRHAAAGTFAGASIPSSVKVKLRNGSYCLETNAGGHTWHATRGAKPSPGAC